MKDRLVAKRITAHLLKEFKDVFRDWIYWTMLLIAPVTLFPAIVGVVFQMTKDVGEASAQRTLRIGVVGDAPKLVAALRKNERVEVQRIEGMSPEAAIGKNKVDLVLVIPAQFALLAQTPGRKPPAIELCFDSRKDMAFSNSQRLNTLLSNYREELKKERLEQLQLDKLWWNKFQFRYSERNHDLPTYIGKFIPYILVGITLISAYYTSLGVVTGEREKKTLSTLLTAGVDRAEIMLCKLIVVMFLALLSLGANLLSVVLTMIILGSGHLLAAIPVVSIALIAVLLIPLVATVCAISMIVVAYARNYQQGGFFFTPFLIAMCFFMGVTALPNISIESILAFVPLVNVSLCIQDIVRGNYNWVWIVVSWLSSAISAVAAVRFTARLLEREDILFGIKESPLQRRLQGSPRAIGFLLAVVTLLMVYVGMPAYLLEPLYGGFIGTQIVVIAIPAFAFVRLLRLDWSSTFALRLPGLRFVLATLCLVPVEIYFVNLVGSILANLFPGGETYMQTLEKVLIAKDRPLWLVVIAVGLVPALCEEFLFRGAVLGALNENSRLSTIRKCSIVGVAFGFIHLSILRFFPTALMGILLTWLRLRSGSIIPSILLHFLNNSIAVYCAVNHWDVLNWGWFGAACAGLVCFLLLYRKL